MKDDIKQWSIIVIITLLIGAICCSKGYQRGKELSIIGEHNERLNSNDTDFNEVVRNN
jgi:hypothetical protein